MKINTQRVAATHSDMNGRCRAGFHRMQKGCGAYPGAASERLSFDPALIGAEDKTVGRENLGKIRICALGAEGFVPAKSRTECNDIDFFNIRDEDHGVGNTCIDEMNVMLGFAKSERLPGALILRTTHFKSHQFSLQHGGNESGLGFKSHGNRLFRQKTRGESCKATGAIPTHLGLPAVAVVVAHAKVRLAMSRLHCQQSICANSSMPVTETGYGRAIE